MGSKTRPGLGFEVTIRSARREQSAAEANTDAPFCIAVLGDFSGRGRQQRDGDRPLAARKLIAIDRDNFDEVLAGFNLSLEIPAPGESGSPITMSIAELGDFHPDALYEKVEIFSSLRSIRERLKDRRTFDAAAREIMRGLEGRSRPEPGSAPMPGKEGAGEVSKGNLLDSVLGTSQAASSDLDYIARTGSIDGLIKEIMVPYVEPGTDPRQPEVLAAVGAAAAAQMRGILHHPRFQSLEAAWRSVYFLISRIETDSHLRVYLLDMSRQELEEDLAGDVGASALHKLFCEPATNDVPYKENRGQSKVSANIRENFALTPVLRWVRT